MTNRIGKRSAREAEYILGSSNVDTLLVRISLDNDRGFA
jgi:hypothetical protein